jgi:hypothetical protein
MRGRSGPQAVRLRTCLAFGVRHRLKGELAARGRSRVGKNLLPQLKTKGERTNATIHRGERKSRTTATAAQR